MDKLHPGVALVLRVCKDLHHLRFLDACRDEEEAALFISDLPNNQLLEGDDRGALVLQEEEVEKGGEGLMEANEGRRMRILKKRMTVGGSRRRVGEEGRQMLKMGRGWERQEEG